MSRAASFAVNASPTRRRSRFSRVSSRRHSVVTHVCKCTCKKAWSNELHGLTRLLQSKTRFDCAFWAILVGACFALAFWHNKTLLRSYIDDSTRLHYTIKWNRMLHFPNLTICPANPDGLDFDALEADIVQRVGDLQNVTRKHLMVFAMASAGFRYFEAYIRKWNASYIEELSKIFEIWRGNRTTSEFYRFMYEEHGLQCEQMFHECVYGSIRVPCCQVFQPMYVALRGRCFRLRMLYQQDFGEAGELDLRLKQLRSPYISGNKQMNQYVLHVSDAYPDVRLFPRYYLNRNRALALHLNAVRYRLFPENQYCSTAEEDQGMGTCFINSWLRTNVIESLNCTLFYMQYKTPQMDVCEPRTVVANYFHVTATSPTEALRSSKISDAQCLPACRREEIRVTVTRNQLLPETWTGDAPFMLKMTFWDLQSEEYREVVTTSLPGFISEIGGQYGLWLGITSTGIIQLAFSICYGLWYCSGHWRSIVDRVRQR